MASKPMRTARCAAATKASRTRAISSAAMARGMCQPGPNGSADGAMVSQGSCSGLSERTALPGPLRGGLAARMGELDTELGGAGAPAEIDDAPECRLVLVGIKPHAAMGDAAVALHMGRLDDDEAGARVRQHAEMGDVPVGGAAVDRAVLAHRRDDDAIFQFDATEADRRKQGAGHVREDLR